MGSRLDLQEELEKFLPNVYYQPPSTKTMKYPCIVYNKIPKSKSLANNGVYLSKQGYQLTVIEQNPDSGLADEIELSFWNCSITQHYTVNNLNHTTLKLYY